MSQTKATRPVSERKPAQPPIDDPSSILDDGQEPPSRLLLFQYVPSWLTSFIVHVVVIILLAIVPILVPRKETVNLIAGDSAPAIETPAEINLDPLEDLSDAPKSDPSETTEPTVDPIAEAPDITQVAETLSLSDAMLNPADVGMQVTGDVMGSPVSGHSELAGRSKDNHAAMANEGWTPGSENAVLIGLKWLADHQLPDGSWNFNHQLGPGKRTSPNPGEDEMSTIAATGLCLLAFLGNGQTHLEGDYKATVEKALAYLVEKQVPVTASAGRLMDDPNSSGAIYSHGIATIALAEAYAMTKDSRLHDPAQAAINYLAIHQDPAGGGWRYFSKQAGDLSVSGWQFMALKSGLLGELTIPKNVMTKANRFLDNLSFQSGALYGYQVGNERPSATMSAVGLLCRMYTGWKRENAALQRGVAYLAERIGPSLGDNPDLYYDYYATQVMRQFGGDLWKEWNKQMRDYLIKTQSTEGPTKGSWYFSPGSDIGIRPGGRIYCTALAIMTLEVYYRYMPIYKNEVLEEEFPLD